MPKFHRKAVALLALMAAIPATAESRTAGKVLVVLSSEDKITLKNELVHPTGFFLPELMVPLKKLLDAGYEPVFANPHGSKPVMDKISDTPFWLGDAPGASPEVRGRAGEEYRNLRRLCEKLGICGEGLVGTKNAKSFSQVISEGLDIYAAVLVPGGHAPMEDLWKDRELGQILRYFHLNRKPTALICHGPIALLSTLDEAEGKEGWIYKGYSLAVFTTAEEQQEEPGQDNALGGYVKFYPDQALETAGASVKRAPKWTSNVVVDRELITGQNPMSEEAFANALVQSLENYRHK
ncbi:MAG: type 1 glutamine amidotransferase domain-containing protein [Elusimicrobia bacterium]|nr:type 1 glutamine amidotransferase domain-containing protein [Elusimicrobiota bacterium]